MADEGERRRSGRARKTLVNYKELLDDDEDDQDDEDQEEPESDDDDGDVDFQASGRGNGSEPAKRKRGRPKGSKNRNSGSVSSRNGATNKAEKKPQRPVLTEEELALRRKRMLEKMPKGMLAENNDPPRPNSRGAEDSSLPPMRGPGSDRRALASAHMTQQRSKMSGGLAGSNGSGSAGLSHAASFKTIGAKSNSGTFSGTDLFEQHRNLAKVMAAKTLLSPPQRGYNQRHRGSESSFNSAPLAGGTPGSATSIKKQKRPKLRKPMNSGFHPDGIDFSPPSSTETSWNASEVIKGFLYIGAGYDVHGRCLVNRSKDPPELKLARQEWCLAHQMCYAVNMAGSPLQVELKGMHYCLKNTKFCRVDMNDLDTWNEAEMIQGFEAGAAFIEEAWRQHRKVRTQSSLATSGVKIVPPTILVHCVAGVNRSPMCVVWWLARYHGVHIKDAWDLVRSRRDQGAFWKDVTLGGEAPPAGYEPSKEEIENAAIRKFQHRYDKPAPQIKTAMEEHAGTTDKVEKEITEKDPKDENGFSAALEQAPAQVKYPKALWYRNAERLLKKYFHWRVSLSGTCTEIYGVKASHVSEPVLVQKKVEDLKKAEGIVQANLAAAFETEQKASEASSTCVSTSASVVAPKNASVATPLKRSSRQPGGPSAKKPRKTSPKLPEASKRAPSRSTHKSDSPIRGQHLKSVQHDDAGKASGPTTTQLPTPMAETNAATSSTFPTESAHVVTSVEPPVIQGISGTFAMLNSNNSAIKPQQNIPSYLDYL